MWMQRALALAEQGIGLTRPNPPVGAVIVRKNRVVGEGWHRRAGGPHAEVYALRSAGRRAQGATLYVTLEPCSTWGRTPPCTELILASGIRRVVVACRDPNPRHRGRGLRQLRKAGLEVVTGVCRSQAQRLIAPFRKWVETGLPWVTLKLGMSLDGRIADGGGASRWITSPEARRRVQELRRKADAILIGRRTAERDDPRLLPRPARGRRPYRVVVDGRGVLPPTLRLFRDAHAEQTIVFTSRASPQGWRRRITAGGARLVVLPGSGPRVDLRSVLKKLAEAGILHVLCEGGGILAGQLLKLGLLDEVVLFYGTVFLGEQGIPGVRLGPVSLKRAPRMALEHAEMVGRSWMVTGRIEPRSRRGHKQQN